MCSLALGAATVVVDAGFGRGDQGGERPGEADGGKPVVLHPAIGDDLAPAGCPCDRGRAGEGFEGSRVGEAVAVIADLGEEPGAGLFTRPGKLVMTP